MKNQTTESNSLSLKKASMIDALTKSMGVVTTAAKSIGIDRSTHYEWLKEDEHYSQIVNGLADIALDFAETQLFKRMDKGSDASIIFYLKTKGKGRGYIERSEQDIKVSTSKLPDWLLTDGDQSEL